MIDNNFIDYSEVIWVNQRFKKCQSLQKYKKDQKKLNFSKNLSNISRKTMIKLKLFHSKKSSSMQKILPHFKRPDIFFQKDQKNKKFTEIISYQKKHKNIKINKIPQTAVKIGHMIEILRLNPNSLNQRKIKDGTKQNKRNKTKSIEENYCFAKSKKLQNQRISQMDFESSSRISPWDLVIEESKQNIG